MIERGERPTEIPLFDRIPEVLKDREEEIRQTFDGTWGNRGIAITLNPVTGDLIRAVLVDLISGKVVLYQHSPRGKWSSETHVVEEGSRKFERLESVHADVKDKFKRWKMENPMHDHPIREWATVKYVKPPKTILPEEWFESVAIYLPKNADKLLEKQLAELQEKPKLRRTSRGRPRERSGPVEIIRNARNEDLRSASASNRRNTNRDRERAGRALGNR